MTKRITILFFILSAFISCSQDDFQPLELDITNHKGFLIPASTASCKNIKESENTFEDITDDIQGKYFTVRGLKFIWKHAYNDLTISLVRVKFTNKNLTGGNFSCVIGGDDLLALRDEDDSLSSYIPWTATIAHNEQRSYDRRVEVETNCDIKCGGVQTADLNFVASGTVEVIGFMTTPEGDEIPIKATTPFSVENIK